MQQYLNKHFNASIKKEPHLFYTRNNTLQCARRVQNHAFDQLSSKVADKASASRNLPSLHLERNKFAKLALNEITSIAAGDNKRCWTQRLTFFGELLTRKTKAANT